MSDRVTKRPLGRCRVLCPKDPEKGTFGAQIIKSYQKTHNDFAEMSAGIGNDRHSARRFVVPFDGSAIQKQHSCGRMGGVVLIYTEFPNQSTELTMCENFSRLPVVLSAFYRG